MSDKLKSQVEASLNRAEKAANRIKLVAISIIMDELTMTKPQARKMYRETFER